MSQQLEPRGENSFNIAHQNTAFSVSREHLESYRQWKTMSGWPSIIDQVIDRSELPLEPWFVPTAPAVAIASDAWLRRTGYNVGSQPHPDWFAVDERHDWRRSISGSMLMVREGLGQWSVERTNGPGTAVVLALRFGSLPFFTGSSRSAIWLADHCQNELPHELCWVRQRPDIV
jgi:hypothetical protein